MTTPLPPLQTTPGVRTVTTPRPQQRDRGRPPDLRPASGGGIVTVTPRTAGLTSAVGS